MAGTVFLLAVYTALMLLIVGLYRRSVRRLHSAPGPLAAIDLVTYLLIMWSIVALLVGEMTNVLHNMALTQILPVWIARVLLGRRRSPVGPDGSRFASPGGIPG